MRASRLSDVGASALDARVAVAPSGGALAVWDRSDGTHWIVQPVKRISGQAWRAA